MGTTSLFKRAQALLRIRNKLARECLAELLAVFVLILITLSSAAQMVTSFGTKGDIFSAYLAGALGIMVAVYMAVGVSGAHLNPAFSLALCLLEQFPWWKFPIYVAVQVSGAFIASGAVYALYYDAIQHYSNGTLTVSGPRETASIFATYPADYLSISNGFLDQVGASVGSRQIPPAVPVPAALSCRAGSTGDGHSAADRGHPGHAGHPQQGCPQRPGAGGRGPAGALHRALHGLQLRLRHQPRAGFRAPALHLRGGLGHGGLQQGQWVVVGAGGGTAGGGRRGLGRLPALRGFPPPGGGGRPRGQEELPGPRRCRHLPRHRDVTQGEGRHGDTAPEEVMPGTPPTPRAGVTVPPAVPGTPLNEP